MFVSLRNCAWFVSSIACLETGLAPLGKLLSGFLSRLLGVSSVLDAKKSLGRDPLLARVLGAFLVTSLCGLLRVFPGASLDSTESPSVGLLLNGHVCNILLDIYIQGYLSATYWWRPIGE